MLFPVELVQKRNEFTSFILAFQTKLNEVRTFQYFRIFLRLVKVGMD